MGPRIGWLASVLGLVLLAVPATPSPASSAGRPSLAAYRGLASWVDIYETATLADPQGTVGTMAANGVRTIFLETSNYSRPRAILDPGAVSGFIDAAHARGMRVVAWYLPSFQDLKKDLRWSLAAIHFRSSTGQRVDSFGLDIEASVVTDPATRTRRLLMLSRWIRDAVGPRYPLGAITPNPIGLDTKPRRFWPNFPYERLRGYFDVFVPMVYFGSVAQGLQAAHDYTAGAIDLVREHTGDPTVPIHVIGGLAGNLDGAEVRGFVHAVRERGVIGASLYNFSEMDASDWAEMRNVPVNPRESPALPVAVGDREELGNIPGTDGTHPKEVFYETGGAPGTWDLFFQAFDVQPGEVQLWVNWQEVGELSATEPGSWSESQTVQVEDSLLRNRGTNYIQFVAAGTFPNWSEWGVRGVSMEPIATVPGAPILSATAGTASVSLFWTVPANGGSPITGYDIYRGTLSGGETLLASLGKMTSYVDSGVTPGTAYYYQVSAVNAVGEGPRSNEVSATPT